MFGYRWELLGGRLLSTYYAVMLRRLSMVEGEVRSKPRSVFPPRTLSHEEISYLAAVPESSELMLSPFGRSQGFPEQFSRWCDNFHVAVSSRAEAVELASFIVYLHARCCIPLHDQKLFLGQLLSFGGIDFDSSQVPRLWIPRDKNLKLTALLAAACAAERLSLAQLETLIGLLVFCTRGFFSQACFSGGGSSS